MSATIEVRGVPELLGTLERAGQVIPAAAVAGLQLGGAAIFAESQREVPRRTGTLARSGRLLPPVQDGKDTDIVISYGGAGARSYARIQHESTYYKHRAGQKARFLSDPSDRLGQYALDQAERMVRRAVADL